MKENNQKPLLGQVTLLVSDILELLDNSAMLTALQQAGVDSWGGYEEAQLIFDKDPDIRNIRSGEDLNIISKNHKEIFNKIILCTVLLNATYKENTDKKMFQTVAERDLMGDIILDYMKGLTQELEDNEYT